MPVNTIPLQPDDNLRNGQTYTFQFLGGNVFLDPSVSDLTNDLIANAPDFVTSLQITSAHDPTVSLLHTAYSVQFTYEGDGSDVVSDLAAAFVAAALAGSNDSIMFAQAFGAPISQVPTTAQQTLAVATAGVGSAAQSLGEAVGKGVGGVSSGLFSNLGASGWVVVALAILLVVGYFSMTTGIRFRGAEA